MTAVSSAQRGAKRAADSTTLDVLTRIGFIAYGLLHVGLAWLALQISFGHGGQEGDQAGAFRTVAEQPFGKVLLIIMIVGLCAMAIWQGLLAAIGHQEERGAKKVGERVLSGGRAVAYAALAFTAGKVVAGAPASNASSQQNATEGVMSKPAGVWLVGLIGLGVLVAAGAMVWYGAKKKFEDKLHTEKMNRKTKKVGRVLGMVGYIAKAVAYGIVGGLLIDAAVTHDPSKSRGLDAALHTLAGQPFGTVLLIVVAVGLAAFAVFCFFQSRYRKVGS
jgi:cytochrome bd-type quinol oxidase subunit 2